MYVHGTEYEEDEFLEYAWCIWRIFHALEE